MADLSFPFWVAEMVETGVGPNRKCEPIHAVFNSLGGCEEFNSC